MKNSKHKMKISKHLLLLCFLTISTYVSFGGSGPISSFVNVTSLNNGTELKVKDPFRSINYDLTSYDATVALIYGRENRTDISSFTAPACSVTYTLTYYDENYVQLGQSTNNLLTISFNGNNPVYQNLKTFSGISGNVKVTVTALTISGAPSDARLELTLINKSSKNLSTASDFGYNSSSQQFYWSFIKGAESYQLEWVFLDIERLGTQTPTVSDPFSKSSQFYKEPVRVNTSNQHFILSTTYPKGKLYCRMRGVGTFLGSGTTTLRYTSWKYLDNGVIDLTTSPFEPIKNWQTVTNYTEDGQYKKVVSFFDGSMRSRQVLTNLSSEDKTLVAETKYDYEGRPSIQVLPVPDVSGFTYRENFNKFSKTTKDAYDNSNSTGPDQLLTTTGASKYYSSGNNMETTNRDYIPDAGGYPYTQTEYTMDGTGRVYKQSGLGPNYKLQEDGLTETKYTRYVYGNTNKTELELLFGSNVGVSQHYKKDAVVDPNGQVSVAYKDQEGRTIATSLAGKSPENLQGLSSNIETPITVNLDDNNSIDWNNYVSRSESSILNVVDPTEYTFNYSLTGMINHASGLFEGCKGCTYDLKITILKPDGTEVDESPIEQTAIKPSQVNCSTDVSFPYSIPEKKITFTQIGKYTVIKELKLNDGAIQAFYSDITLAEGYPSLDIIERQHTDAIDKSKCDITCEDHCLTKILAANDALAANDSAKLDFNNPANQAILNQRVKDCVDSDCGSAYTDPLMEKAADSECASIYDQMILQISPGGQFYDHDPGEMQRIYNATISNTWVDENGLTVIKPSNLSELLDPKKFKSAWALNMMTAHREYCHYTFCKKEGVTKGSAFDKKLAIVKNTTEAGTKGYWSNPVNKDDYFNTTGSPGLSQKTSINNQVTQYFNEQANNKDLNGGGQSATPIPLSDYASSPVFFNGETPSPEQIWQRFYSTYIGIKANYVRTTEIAACGNYFTDDNTIVPDKTIPTDQASVNNLISTKSPESNCPGACSANVDKWINSLAEYDNCGKKLAQNSSNYNAEKEVYEFPDLVEAQLAQSLTNYCMSSCGSANPMAYMLREDLASNPDLVSVQTTLSTYGCSLDAIAVTNPYTSVCNTVTERTLTPCTYQYVDAISKFITSVNEGRVDVVAVSTCPDKDQIVLGDIVKFGNTQYYATYAISKDCNVGCNMAYVTIQGAWTSPTSPNFNLTWSNSNGDFYCPIKDAYKNPVGCTNSTVTIRFKYKDPSDVWQYIEKQTIVSISAPFIDKSVTWDDQTLNGVAVNIQYKNGATVVTQRAYIEIIGGTPAILWKDNTSISNPKQVCTATNANTCSNQSNAKMQYHFDGLDDKILCGNDAELNITGAITLEAWVKPDVSNQTGSIVTKHCTTNNRSYSIFYINGSFRFDIYDVYDNWYYHLTPANYTDVNTWYHVAGTYNPTTGALKLYVNGTLVGNATYVGKTLQTATVPVYIGSYGCSGERNPFDGKIDEVRIWNKERTAAEIVSNKDCSLGTTPIELVGYWKLDEGAGTVTKDASIYGNNGIISNQDPTSWEAAGNPTATCNPSCPETSASAIIDLTDETFYSLGDELQQNGDFSANTGGWKSFQTGSLIPDLSPYVTTYSGNLTLDVCLFGSGGGAVSTVPLVSGKKYQLSFSYNNGFEVNTGSDPQFNYPTQGKTVATFTGNGGNVKFGYSSSYCPQNYIDNVSIKELIPACLNVYEGPTPILSSCVPTSGKTKDQIFTDLVAALNSTSTSNYVFSKETGTYRLLAAGKPGKGATLNGKDLSVVDEIYNGSTFLRYEILAAATLDGGKKNGQCCENDYEFTINWSEEKQKCLALQEDIAKSEAYAEWQEAVKTFTSQYIEGHFNKCFDSLFNEDFTYTYKNNEYHYTLYYFDQAGNLEKTYPPLAVKTGTNGVHNENLATKYQYDGLNALIFQHTPDGGDTYFWYDDKGRLRLSQNAEQVKNNQFSYTSYDKLGRIIEVGQIEGGVSTYNRTFYNDPVNAKTIVGMFNDAAFPGAYYSSLKQKTNTVYDQGAGQNLRGRVASVSTAPDGTTTSTTTSYSYDAHGNVNKLTQSISGFAARTIDYEYDLISGTVKKVYYQKGFGDQFIHRYRYDADKRLKAVYTSADGYIWEEDATYFYHKHGPLARMELGESKVQGLDYIYSIQGWLKGVNIPEARTGSVGSYRTAKDPGKDGFGSNVNQFIAQDEMAFTLGYHKDDYTAIGSGINLGAGQISTWGTTGLAGGIKQSSDKNLYGLYNGNIAFMVTQVHSMGQLLSKPESTGLSAQAFQYDQLNRLKEARFYDSYSSNVWGRTNVLLNASPYDAYYSYDVNGNIDTAKINGKNSSLMDHLKYNYTIGVDGKLNNKLNYVSDIANDGVSVTDIKPGQIATNYQYDAIGNLISDDQAKKTISWSVYGKVLEVTPTTAEYQAGKVKLRFTYDAMGNRVKKETLHYSGVGDINEFYIRDASGNVMARYQLSIASQSIEYGIFGSSRLGTFVVTNATGANVTPCSLMVNRKSYELSNHLGNVLAVVGDKKIGIDTDGDQDADYYTATVKSANNYYPFGMTMEGRNANDYRYGFNGQEKDDEIGEGLYTAQYWEYDARLGKRWNVDPVVKEWESPYACFNDNPIVNVDPSGLDSKPIDASSYGNTSKAQPGNSLGIRDNYLIKHDGSISVERTKDKTDNFKFQGADGKIIDLGTFNKTENGLVHITGDGTAYSIGNTKATKRYMMPEAFAAFLGASMNYYNEYGLQIQVNQFSNIEGGHSSHGGNGQFIDYRYSNTKGNVNEPVWSQWDNFDETKSQFMVDELVKFGYNSTPSNLRGGKYSILTQQGFTTNPALSNTGYYTGHHHHVHLQNYNKEHVITSIQMSNPHTLRPGSDPSFIQNIGNWLERHSIMGSGGHKLGKWLSE